VAPSVAEYISYRQRRKTFGAREEATPSLVSSGSKAPNAFRRQLLKTILLAENIQTGATFLAELKGRLERSPRSKNKSEIEFALIPDIKRLGTGCGR
jgi:hypothetical protein